MEGEEEGEVGGEEGGRGEGRQWDTPDHLGIICKIIIVEMVCRIYSVRHSYEN